MTTSANIAKIFEGPAGYALAIGVGGLVLYLLYNKAKKDIGQAADTTGSLLSGNNSTLANVNLKYGDNSSYVGAGLPGTLGAAANTVSGGTLSSLGDWLGGKLYTAINGDYDPNAAPADKNTPAVNPAVIGNPVSPSPSILQYTYKQDTIDTANLLNTDQLFTPGAGGGGYLDDSSGTGAAPTAYAYDF